jgi:Protein of unknown function (DUF2786)
MGAQGDTWWDRFQLGERERILAALSEAAPGLGRAETDASARRSAEARLAGLLVEAVTSAWRRGWQPADLVQTARRELTGRHVELLRRAVGIELSGYPPSTIDARWRPQLEELAVHVAPSAGPDWLTADDPSGHWLDTLQACTELIRFLGLLVGLVRLTALPGTAGAGTPATEGVDPRVLARVRALLAKAESTTFPAEAETFTAGAQALMARHSIDAALVAAADHANRAEPAGARIWIDGPYESAKVSLLSAISGANRCQAVWHKQLGACTVLGFDADLAATDALFTSLLVQATHAMNVAGPRVDAAGRSRTRAFRHSFLVAFASRIGERLAEAARGEEHRAAGEAGGDRLLPVLAAREAEVDRYVAELFPRLRQGARVSVGDGEGWASGRAAADRAALGFRGRLPA